MATVTIKLSDTEDGSVDVTVKSTTKYKGGDLTNAQLMAYVLEQLPQRNHGEKPRCNSVIG